MARKWQECTDAVNHMPMINVDWEEGCKKPAGHPAMGTEMSASSKQRNVYSRERVIMETFWLLNSFRLFKIKFLFVLYMRPSARPIFV